MGKTGIRVEYVEFWNKSKGAKVGTRNRNVIESNTGALQTNMKQGGMRLDPGNQVWRNKLEFWYGFT